MSACSSQIIRLDPLASNAGYVVCLICHYVVITIPNLQKHLCKWWLSSNKHLCPLLLNVGEGGNNNGTANPLCMYVSVEAILWYDLMPC